jgi:hypothetical protein
MTNIILIRRLYYIISENYFWNLLFIISKLVNSNPANGEVHSIPLYAITFVDDLQQVGGFLRVLQFSPSIKLSATIKLT